MDTKKWAAWGLAVMVSLATAACSDDDNNDSGMRLPIPGNAQAYVLSKEGTTFSVTRLFTQGGESVAAPAQAITGLPAGEELVGMDFRPRDGKLYLVGRNGATAESGGAVYVIGTLAETGSLAATTVSQLIADPADLTTPFAGLADGVSYGVDFNPQANALRLVGSNGSNLRIPFGGAGAIPAQLVVVTDTNLVLGGVAKTGVSAAAYTNNVDLAASTSLLVMSGLELFTQAPPNDGVLTLAGALSLDNVAFSASSIHFDILSTAGTNAGFVFAQESGSDDVLLGTVNLATGALSAIFENEVGDRESIIGLAMKAAPL